MRDQLSLALEFKEQTRPQDDCVFIEPSNDSVKPYLYYGPAASVEIVCKAWLIVDPQVTLTFPDHRRCESCYVDQGHAWSTQCAKCASCDLGESYAYEERISDDHWYRYAV